MKNNKKILLLILIVVAIGCKTTKTFSVQSIRQGYYLDIALEENFNDFFIRRMKNQKVSKIQGQRCEILYKNTTHIYYGYTYTSSKNDSAIKILYKTPLPIVIQKFPEFEKYEGFVIKEKASEYITKNVLNKQFDNLFYKIDYQINLINTEQIEVIVKYKILRDFVKEKGEIKILLNRETLQLISANRF